MTAGAIIFANIQQSGWAQMSGAPPAVMNVVIDGRGTVRRRPGIIAYSEAPTTSIDADGIQGLYATNGGKVFAVGGGTPARTVYRVSGGSAAPLGGSGSPELSGTLRPTFAETQNLLVIAAGGDMQKVDLTTDASDRLGGDPPPASHVIANAQRLEANDVLVNRDAIRFSGISGQGQGYEEWNLAGIGTSGFFEAEARPDPILAIGEDSNEIFAFGQTNLQIFTPDPAETYVPVSTREYGMSAPYSVIRMDDRFVWLDHRRRFIISNGRTSEDISGEIDQTLQDMARVDDCFGYRVTVGIVDAMVWTFPSEGRTFVYQVGAGWGQWQGRDEHGTNWAQFMVSSATHRPDDDVSLVGTTDGRIGQFSNSAGTDLGEPIVAYAETGYLNRDTGKRKHCQAVRLTFERPDEILGEDEVIGKFSWSDSPGVWNPPRLLRLDARKGVAPVITLRSLGVYRKRAWRFEFSSPKALVLSEVEEEFDVLDQ